MKLTVFASGSTGNCALLESGNRRFLLDGGISARRICQGLARAGVEPASLSGIFITHEHIDHIRGLPVFLKKTPMAVFAPGAAADVICRSSPGVRAYMHTVTPGAAFSLGELEVLPFPTSHDALESVGYRLADADGSVFALATDTGCVTESMLSALSGADMAMIEANHDEDMLRRGPYPPALKRRILSETGHLSNADCARLAAYLARHGTKTVVLGHMSKQNNLPALALETVGAALGGTGIRLFAAPELGFLEVDSEICCV